MVRPNTGRSLQTYHFACYFAIKCLTPRHPLSIPVARPLTSVLFCYFLVSIAATKRGHGSAKYGTITADISFCLLFCYQVFDSQAPTQYTSCAATNICTFLLFFGEYRCNKAGSWFGQIRDDHCRHIILPAILLSSV